MIPNQVSGGGFQPPPELDCEVGVVLLVEGVDDGSVGSTLDILGSSYLILGCFFFLNQLKSVS